MPRRCCWELQSQTQRALSARSMCSLACWLRGTAYALVVWGPWKKLGILWKAVILSLSVALFIGVELSMMVGAPFWLTSAGLFVGTFLAVELGNLMISKTALAKVV